MSMNQINMHSHTLCGNSSCVEVLLDKDMQLRFVSEPYNPHEHSPVIDPEKLTMTLKPINQRRISEAIAGAETKEPEKRGGCKSCAERAAAREKDAKQHKTGLLKRLAKGVPGLLKSELGIDQADPQEIDRRKTVCQGCPDGIYDFGVCSEERGGCGCFLASKVTIKGESCPKGHW